MIYREIPEGHEDQKTVKERLIPEAVTMITEESFPAESISEVSSENAAAVTDAGEKTESSGSGSSSGTLININTADKAALMTLSGIGEKKALSIIEYRTQNGPFSDISELSLVSGIGKKTVESIAPFITVTE
ncbi:MAG: helix-hairpin-helix domain-containing protein [Oscillospiraceae bacterium]|nr:helix-hairpin-helix domain-containing protein [Oscillospiraceae bacterium]MBP1592580.1 helix-hairpin-helix domain-containing protein [Oscillospiraceae bacterium]MBQ5336185.1 helix-hairpin-helix domain-containing protein [Oscillospiraceae bacterium]